MDPRAREALEQYREMRAALLAEFPELEDDAECLADTLEGGSDLADLIASLIREARRDAALSDGLKTMIEEEQTRRKRLSSRADKRKEIAFALMQAADIRKVDRADFSASIRAVPASVQITDETALPEAFIRIKREADKTAINDALKAGGAVPGAILANGGETLSVRVL